MKSIRKIITSAAAAAVIATVGATTAFALSDGVPSVDSVNKQYQGTYMYLNYGAGYTETTSRISGNRYSTAYVASYNAEGDEIRNKFSSAYINIDGTVKANITITAADVSYRCIGSIYTADSPAVPVLETVDRKYPQ